MSLKLPVSETRETTRFVTLGDDTHRRDVALRARRMLLSYAQKRQSKVCLPLVQLPWRRFIDDCKKSAPKAPYFVLGVLGWFGWMRAWRLSNDIRWLCTWLFIMSNIISEVNINGCKHKSLRSSSLNLPIVSLICRDKVLSIRCTKKFWALDLIQPK